MIPVPAADNVKFVPARQKSDLVTWTDSMAFR
jgi:hypothetical protein